MAYVMENPNPSGSYVGDCVVRAISLANHEDWKVTFIGLCVQGYEMCDMPSSNKVWGEYLKRKGYHRFIIPDTCPECYTVKRFSEDHPTGTYILGTGTHVVAVINGNYIDSWNSGDEIPIYYWYKEN